MKKTILSVIIFLLLSSLAAFALDDYLTSAEKSEFAKHRNAVFKLIGKNVAFYFGAASRPDLLRWKQDADFYYLTGCQVPNAALILDGKKKKAILFLPMETVVSKKVYGVVIYPGEEAEKAYGISDTRPIEEFEKALQEISSGKSRIYLPQWPEESYASSYSRYYISIRSKSAQNWYSGYVDWERALFLWVLDKFPGMETMNSTNLVNDLRLEKTRWEMKQINTAMNIAAKGIQAAMNATKRGATVHDIKAAALAEVIKSGSEYPAFSANVSSGPVTGIAGYHKTGERLRNKDLVITELGPTWNYYVAEIARTWPVSGTFSKNQAKVYQDLLDIRAMLLQEIKPGITPLDIADLYYQALEDRGYSKAAKLAPAHPIGLSASDPVSIVGELPEGTVLALELRLYLADEKSDDFHIGDMIYLTKTKAKLMSDDIPVTINEIESFLASRQTP